MSGPKLLMLTGLALVVVPIIVGGLLAAAWDDAGAIANWLPLIAAPLGLLLALVGFIAWALRRPARA